MCSLTPFGDGPSPIFDARRFWPRAFKSFAAAVFSFVIAGQAMAQDASILTLDVALRVALARSATLQAQEAAVRSAREMAVSAGRLPDPTLRLSVNNLLIEESIGYSLSDELMTMRSVEIMQTFSSDLKRQARASRYAREADASISMRSMQKARLLARTAGAWFDCYYEEQMLSLLQSQREEANRTRKAVESAYRGGRSSQAEVLAAHAAVARIDDSLLEIEAERLVARAQLRRWIGNAAEQALGIPPKIDHSRFTEYPLDHEMNRYPDIAVMNARERIALAEVDIARQEKRADWSWSLMYSKRGEQFGDMVSLGVSIPLQWDQASKQNRDLAASLERVEQVRSEREEIRRKHLFDVQRLLANWRSGINRLRDYDKILIPLANERVRASLAAFSGGKASLSEVLDAQRMVTDIRLERLRIEKQSAAWWAELEYLIPQEQSEQESRTVSSNPVTQES